MPEAAGGVVENDLVGLEGGKQRAEGHDHVAAAVALQALQGRVEVVGGHGPERFASRGPGRARGQDASKVAALGRRPHRSAAPTGGDLRLAPAAQRFTVVGGEPGEPRLQPVAEPVGWCRVWPQHAPGRQELSGSGGR